jgi:steroid delta-isomerase-like uncharacterized protein
MSQENVKIAQQHIEAYNRGDVDALVALVSPDVAWEDSVFWSEPARVYRGRAEVREWFNKIIEPWESFHIEVEEITEAVDYRVFVGGLLTTRGKGSGVETEVRGWFVLWVADSKITRRQVFLDRDEALEAAKLEE